MLTEVTPQATPTTSAPVKEDGKTLPTGTQTVTPQNGEAQPDAQPVPPTEPTEVEKPTPDKAKTYDAFAVLARKEKALVARTQAVAAKEKELESLRAEYQKYENLKKEAATDPNKWLEAADLNYDKLTQYQLNGGGMPANVAFERAMAEIAELRAQLEGRDKQNLEEKTKADKENYDRQLQEFFDSTKEQIKANPKWELINSLGQHDYVLAVIQAGWKMNKNISYDVAADAVEKELEEKAFNDVANTTKFKSRYQPLAPKAPETKPAPSAVAQAKSLTNQMTPTTQPENPSRIRTDEERMAAALEKFKTIKGLK